MAGDPTFDIKIIVYPFQEMRKKKLKPMETKEIGMKKPKNFEFKDKFSVTSVKWNKKIIEEAAKSMFRYDLSILAAQMWENYVPIEKAKNGQDKMKAINEFVKIVPNLVDRTEKKLKQSFAEFKEEVASGASDDAGELKSTRKSLAAGHAGAMVKVIMDYNTEFEKDFEALKKLKAAETKASGGEKAQATEKLSTECASMVMTHGKKLGGLNGVLKKRSAVLAGIPGAMKKSMGKDVSDATKAEYKTSMDALTKGFSPIQSGVSKLSKDAIEAMNKMQRKDVGNTTLALAVGAANKLVLILTKYEELMTKIDVKLKKLEQLAKKR